MKTINQFLQEISKPFILYCDMDGVLTDFEGAVEDFGRGTFKQIADREEESWIWAKISKIGYRFWRDMNWIANGKELWNEIKIYQPIILTAVPRSGFQNCKIGKNIWIDKNLGKDVKREIVFRKDKQNFANSKSILIDDMKKNIDEWRTASGIGILHISNEKTLRKLKILIS